MRIVPYNIHRIKLFKKKKTKEIQKKSIEIVIGVEKVYIALIPEVTLIIDCHLSTNSPRTLLFSTHIEFFVND